MNKKELFMEIPLEELPQIYKIMINLIGREGAFEIGKEFGGEDLYMPRIDTCLIPARNRKICREYKGFNLRELAKKYALTDNGIRLVVKKGKAKGGS